MSDTSSIFARIRESCASVCERARHARIDQAAIEPYALSLPRERFGEDGLDAATHLLGHGEQTLVYILALDSINFGSGYFTQLNKRPGLSGYFTVAAGLKDWFTQAGPIGTEKLRALTPETCAAIFCQDKENSAAFELMSMFSCALRYLGKLVDDQFGGSFTAMIESAQHRAENLITTLREIPYFVDQHRYHGEDIYFYKRAQITCADLSLAFHGQGWGHFTDLANLTSFADNLVPHVLWVDGVLKYTPTLVERIDDGELIEPGSEEEIEMRAAAVHGVELIREALERNGVEVTSMHLDFLLWNRGQGAQYKSMPRHRTRTVYY